MSLVRDCIFIQELLLFVMVGLQFQSDLRKFLFVSLVVLRTMHVKQEGVGFSLLYLPLFACIYMDRTNSLNTFGSTPLQNSFYSIDFRNLH